MSVQFINNLTLSSPQTHTHSHGDLLHNHGPGEHGHTHEHLDHAGMLCQSGHNRTRSYLLVGKYADRDIPDYTSRNFEERGFTVGIGG